MHLFEDCRSFYFHSLINSTFLCSKRLLCLCNKQTNTGLLVDMEFLFSCSIRHISFFLYISAYGSSSKAGQFIRIDVS